MNTKNMQRVMTASGEREWREISHVAYIITRENITVRLAGQTKTISRSEPNADKVIFALKDDDWGLVERLINKPLAISNYYCGLIRVENGLVKYKGRTVDNPVTKRILAFMEEGLPYKPLCAFLTRLMKNKNKSVREALYTFMESENMPIDNKGYLIGYKSLRTDLKDWYSNSVQHKIGQTIWWGARKKEKNSRAVLDYGADCGKFFHIGTFQYASTFNAPDNVVCLCRVDPEFVMSVPEEATMGKIRCRKYTPFAFYDKDGKALPANYFKQ